MSWRSVLLLPTLIRNGLKAPHDERVAWDRYWRGVQRTGAGGDVLWDGASARELEWVLETARRCFDRSLPLLDLGCGNGRYTRALAELAPSALGIDVSESAIAHAQRESNGNARVSFRALDVTAPGLGAALASELGAANVFVRGVLHVLDEARRRSLADNVRALLGERGTVLLVESVFHGSKLDYIEFLGAYGTHIPAPLRRLIEAGLSPPSQFGAPELDRFFPASRFERVESGPAVLDAVATRANEPLTAIPGFYAVLRPR